MKLASICLNFSRVMAISVVSVLLISLFYIPKEAHAGTGLVLTNGAGGIATNNWDTPANAQGLADNNTYATAAPANNARVTGIWNTYGFDSNLPLHAAITKVEIIPQYNVSTNLSTANLEVQAVVNGSDCPASPVVDSTEPTADTDFIVDVTSCRTWTRNDLLNANLGTRIAAHRVDLLLGVTFSLDHVHVRVTYNTPDYEQAAYRWYDNTDSTAAGTVLANQDMAPTLYAPRDRIRLRILLHVSTTTLLTDSEQFKLQYAQKGATCSGLAYNDVTSTSLIAFYNNPSPANNIYLTTGADDPLHSADTIISQAYAETSPFSTLANVAVGQDGLWDISLVGNGALANTTYCLRMVKNDATPLTAYTVYPEVVTAPTGSLNVDIVDASGTSIASPSFGFSSILTPFTCTSSTAVLGSDTQRIRLKNTTDTPGWTVSIAATGGSTSLWSAGTPKYDFNDSAGSPAGCSAGLDSDTYGGQMTINASAGTVAPREVSACTTTGITKGSSAAFVEGTLNAIMLMGASASANTGCFFELTGVSVSQQIPGGQSTGSYSINLTMTVVAN